MSFKDDLEEMEIGSKVNEAASFSDGGGSENENGDSGHDTMDMSVPANKARRVSFAESVDVIKQESGSGLYQKWSLMIKFEKTHVLTFNVDKIIYEASYLWSCQNCFFLVIIPAIYSR